MCSCVRGGESLRMMKETSKERLKELKKIDAQLNINFPYRI